MPYTLELPHRLASEGWKVKIYDRERLEPPHVTIIHGCQVWRLCLRTGAFLDAGSGDIPKLLRQALDHNWAELCAAWNQIHPTNPVSHEDDNEN